MLVMKLFIWRWVYYMRHNAGYGHRVLLELDNGEPIWQCATMPFWGKILTPCSWSYLVFKRYLRVKLSTPKSTIIDIYWLKSRENICPSPVLLRLMVFYHILRPWELGLNFPLPPRIPHHLSASRLRKAIAVTNDIRSKSESKESSFLIINHSSSRLYEPTGKK